MRRLFLTVIIAVAAMQAFAQNTPATATASTATASVQPFRFGYFSYSEALRTMPDYTIAQRTIDDLRAKYDKEMMRVEEEFNQKYELFLDNQQDFAPSIRHKRQAELQELMQKNMAFKEEARRLLKDAEDKAYAPLREKISAALQKVAREKGLAFILNTDGDAVPFVDPTTGFNVQADMSAALQ